MTNLKITKFIILFVCLFARTETISAYVPKEGNVTVNFGSFLSKTDFNESGIGPKNPYLGGIGIIANGDMNSKGALEIGLFHMNKMFFREQNGLFLSEKAEMMHVTMGYRYWISPSFSASLSFSTSYTLGDSRTVYTDFPPGSGIDTSAQDNTEYGTDIALQTELWNYEKYSVILDARYNLSFTNKLSEQGNHYGLLIGLRYFIQEKYIEKSTSKPEDHLKEGQSPQQVKELKSE